MKSVIALFKMDFVLQIVVLIDCFVLICFYNYDDFETFVMCPILTRAQLKKTLVISGEFLVK